MSFSIREPSTRASISDRMGVMGKLSLGISRVDCSAGIGGQKCPPQYARICLPFFGHGQGQRCWYSLRERVFLALSSGQGATMLRLLLHWVLSAIAVWIMAQVVPGIYLSGPRNALIAALVIGLINGTIGLVLKVITFPLTLLTLGL